MTLGGANFACRATYEGSQRDDEYDVTLSGMSRLRHRDVSDEVGLKGPGNPADSYRTTDGWNTLMYAASLRRRKAHTSNPKVFVVAPPGFATVTENERRAG